MEPREQRIKRMTSMYYSRKDVQKAIFDFSKNREICARYFDSFGKRPDSFQYSGDFFEMVKKGATSFHCSEELWEDPLQISTNQSREQLSELRIGWDLLIDIDSKYIDYSKISAQIIIDMLNFHGVKNIGIKFSGSKGFHIIVPWKAFPKKVNNIETSDMFPEYPRIILNYIIEKTKDKLIEKITDLARSSKYVKDFQAPKEVMPDLILVSPRHLFRMPYSLHEKTVLASIVLDQNKISEFQLKDADPLKVNVIDFMPDVKEGEARELLIQALDWHMETNTAPNTGKKSFDFKPIKLENLSEKMFPPSIKKILQGISDGKKRALFILLNLFRSIGMDKDELEKRIYEWNGKNKVSLKKGYIESQISWSYRNKIVPPPNFDKDYYNGIGIIPTDEEMRYKNPINYILKKNSQFNHATKNFKKRI